MNEVTAEEDERVARAGNMSTAVGQSRGFEPCKAGRTREGERFRSTSRSCVRRLEQLEGSLGREIRRDRDVFHAQLWRMMGELTCNAVTDERRTHAAARQKDVACIVETPPLAHVVMRVREEMFRALKQSGAL